MAGNVPDPRTFEKWEDAFQYPVPTVRALEKKLRGHIGENHEKLRTLVGSSYRDLLGTAQTIVDINEEMRNVEELVTRTGRRSDSRILDKIGRNYARFVETQREQDWQVNSLISQLTLLQRVLNHVSKLLRTHGSMLLAAKLLIIARLLHRAATKSEDAPPFAEELGSKLISLRSKLLRRIDTQLGNIEAPTQDLVASLSAFSLATSSGPTDVLTHFQRVRLDSIRQTSSTSERSSSTAPSRRLRVYIETCRECRAIFPDLLRSSLKSLTAGHLIRDPSIQALDELSLDTSEAWISSEIHNYTPFTRHDELQKSKAEQLTLDWSKKGLEALSTSIEKDLSSITHLDALVTARKDTLQAWLSSRQHVRGISPSAGLDKLRRPFQTRGLAIISSSLQSLHDSVSIPLESMFSQWREGSNPNVALPLWSSATTALDTSAGAAHFKRTVIERRRGQGDAASTALVAAFDAVSSTLATTTAQVRKMQDTRWDDDYEYSDDSEPSDEDGEDDDHKKESISTTLSRSDPAALLASFQSTAQATIASLETLLDSAVDARVADCAGPASPGPATLRILRELRARVPVLQRQLDTPVGESFFAQRVVDRIHVRLVESVYAETDAQLAAELTAFAKAPYLQGSLWDGTPPLPVVPSVPAFRYLRALVKRMERLGADLWAPDAVGRLKKGATGVVARELGVAVEVVDAVVEEKREGKVATENGNVGGEADEEKQEAGEGAAEKAEGEDSVSDEKHEPAGNSIDNDGQARDVSEKKPEPAEVATEAASADEHTEAEPDPAEQEAAEAEADKQRKKTQLLFDAAYLRHALSSDGVVDAEDPLVACFTRISKDMPSLDDDAQRARLEKSAAEYWRRTYLLFGLLSY